MNEMTVVDMARTAMVTGMQMAAPVIGASMSVGAGVALVLAATQIHEFTLTFIPKIAAVAAAIFICGPWMMKVMVAFTTQLLASLPQVAP
jgi:flagellar biosynthetic protein FliQ